MRSHSQIMSFNGQKKSEAGALASNRKRSLTASCATGCGATGPTDRTTAGTPIRLHDSSGAMPADGLRSWPGVFFERLTGKSGPQYEVWRGGEQARPSGHVPWWVG